MCKYLPLREYLFLRRGEFIPKYSRYSKYLIRIRKRIFRSKRFLIRSMDEIHYKNISVIGRFIGFQGKIIPRRVTKLTLRQQRLMTTAIKKARILCFLPFLDNELYFKNVRWPQILKRRRKNKNKRRSRKTHFKTQPRTVHPKAGPEKTRPKNEPEKTRPKIEPRTVHPKTRNP
uniref:ribosomal protein S18 n=1 Tax=Gahnia tristis TaxID=388572 RepID=UPI001F13505C|nr:ribosomal protein S18 [Gahnia tristis]ULQ66035.1 ribosomal protein S18 [Gahnia tristis]